MNHSGKENHDPQMNQSRRKIQAPEVNFNDDGGFAYGQKTQTRLVFPSFRLFSIR
jgi:hypothetical protein